MPLVPLDTVRDEILGAVSPLAGRRRPTSPTRVGLVLADDVVTSEPVPPFANTAMDGYAVRAADTAGAGDDRARTAPGRRRARRPGARRPCPSVPARRSGS